MEHRRAPNYFKTFYIRRTFRILPLYLVLVAAYFLLKPHATGAFQPLFDNGSVPEASYLLLLQNFFMAASGDWGIPLLGVTWSVAVEEQFYLLLPIIVYLAPPRAMPVIIGSFILSGPFFRAFTELPHAAFLLPGVVESLGGGTLLAWLFREKRQSFESTAGKVSAAFSILVGAFGMSVPIFGVDTGFLRETFIMLFWAGFFWFVLSQLGNRWTAPLRAAWLVKVGSLSYGLYLLHTPFNHLAFIWLTGADVAAYKATGGNGLFIALVGLAMTTLATWISFTLLERPFVRLSHRFSYEGTPRRNSPMN